MRGMSGSAGRPGTDSRHGKAAGTDATDGETAMTWTWRHEDPAGNPVDGPAAESFSSQSDAESWLGGAWRELVEAGVAKVSLLEGGRVEYTMSLTPADQ